MRRTRIRRKAWRSVSVNRNTEGSRFTETVLAGLTYMAADSSSHNKGRFMAALQGWKQKMATKRKVTTSRLAPIGNRWMAGIQKGFKKKEAKAHMRRGIYGSIVRFSAIYMSENRCNDYNQKISNI